MDKSKARSKHRLPILEGRPGESQARVEVLERRVDSERVNDVRVAPIDVGQRVQKRVQIRMNLDRVRLEGIPKADVQGQVLSDFPIVLYEPSRINLAKVAKAVSLTGQGTDK